MGRVASKGKDDPPLRYWLCYQCSGIEITSPLTVSVLHSHPFKRDEIYFKLEPFPTFSAASRARRKSQP